MIFNVMNILNLKSIFITVFFLSPPVESIVGVSDTSGYDPANDNCRREGIKINNETTCYELRHNTCFGTKLPYTDSTSELVNVSWTQQQLQNDLSKWEGLKNSPKCWAVIQPLLCAVYMPKCQDGVIELASQELCKITRSPCSKLVEQILNDWPEFLKCDDTIRYPPYCKNTEIRELRFNTTSRCMDPMIPVEDSFSYYEGFEGCGLKCNDPSFTDEDHYEMNNLIFWQSIALFLSTGFVIGTYLLDWRSARGFPSIIVFYAVVCYFIANLGWMLQFLPNAKQDIVCRKDGTVRRNELRVGENVFCILVFSLIYFGSIAALGWLAVFAYVWNLTCNAAGRIQKRVDSQVVYFHSLVWFSSITLTILNLSFGKIDGNSMSGVCFIGYTHSKLRIGLFVCPILFAFVAVLFYFSKGLIALINLLRIDLQDKTRSGREHIRSTVVRISIFTAIATAIIILFIVTEVYNLLNMYIWNGSLRDSLLCELHLKDIADCTMKHKPVFGVVGVNICLFFIGGILISSLAWTRTSLSTWKRRLCRICGNGIKETVPHGVVKSHLIARAYAKRNEISENGRLSLKLSSIHGDPVGLNRIIDPNQLFQESNSNQLNREEISSEWLAALPRIVRRRDAWRDSNSSNNSFASEDNSKPPTENGISGSNLELDKHKKKSGLRKLKEKLGSRNRRRRSFSSESSDHQYYYQSSNSDISKQDRKPKSGMSAIKYFGRAWKRGGSISSLESMGIDPRLLGRKMKKEFKPYKRTKEISIQTSLENLPLLNIHNAIVARNLDMVDKSMQTSIECLRRTEISIQTKKCCIKKIKQKEAETAAQAQIHQQQLECPGGEANGPSEAPNAVLELLTPE